MSKPKGPSAITYWDLDNTGYRRIEPKKIQHDGKRWIMHAYDTVNQRDIEVPMDSMADVIGKPTIAIRRITEQ